MNDDTPPDIGSRPEQSAIDALKSLAATDLFKHRRSALERKARQEANVPRKNTPKAERWKPPVTAVDTSLTADLLGHAPRPRKRKR